MLEGEIIRFYRERAKMTQAQLGEGICTTTHVSKIERGKTAYSPDIINLFSRRLNIDVQKEIDTLRDLDHHLDQWHTAIIMEQIPLVKKIKNELEQITFIQSSKYAVHYHLLTARYHILLKEHNIAFNILHKIQELDQDLSPYEKNLYLHVQGIYYIENKIYYSHEKPIEFLKEIDLNIYRNKEYYYHLSIAYHLIDSKVMAYSYGEKALDFFKESNNYSRAIDAESLMLLQLSSDPFCNFNELIERYQSLIQATDSLRLKNKKGLLLNNLGYEYFYRKEYKLAKSCYKEALLLVDKANPMYLLRLYNYIDTSLEGNLSKKSLLLKQINEGLTLATQYNQLHYSTLFKLLKLKAEGTTDKYYGFIEKQAFPQFSSRKHILFMKRFGKQLYDYYVETNQHIKAIEISNMI
ncbi:helix-turn-helix domain-containing protein [Bacillus spongiae]|uniref:Helix-turn-helix domain-containing protein n=1 Tax=Bacillus spongiae TaxID=2683610 RepID=A0ABU8HEN7_9BACI